MKPNLVVLRVINYINRCIVISQEVMFEKIESETPSNSPSHLDLGTVNMPGKYWPVKNLGYN